MASQFISREFHGKNIDQRIIDKYFDATAMCKATGKRWFDYHRLDNTKVFIDAPVYQDGNTRYGQRQRTCPIC